MILAASVSAGLVAWGENAHPWSGAGTSQLEIESAVTAPVCTWEYTQVGVPGCSGFDSAPFYSEPYYDPVGNATVILLPPDELLLDQGFLGASIPVALPDCAPTALYPAPGNEIAVGCEQAGANASLDFVDSATGALEGNVSLSSVTWFDSGAYAWNASSQLLYLIAGQTVSTLNATQYSASLLTVDTESRQLTGIVAFPAYGGGPIALDPERPGLLFFDYLNGTLDQILPSSGATSAGLGFPGLEEASFTIDPNNGELLMGEVARNGSFTLWGIELDSFRLASEQPVDARCGGLVDPLAAVVYVSDCATITELNTTSMRVLGSVDLRSSSWTGGWTILPGAAQFLLGQVNGGGESPTVSHVALRTLTVAGPSYGALPVVGSELPFAVLAIGLLAGLLVLGVLGAPQLIAFRQYRVQTMDSEWARLVSEPRISRERRP
jgi:hypothetical protein